MQTIGGTFLGLLLLFGCTQVFVSGQDSQKSEARLSKEGFGPGIEGVWLTTVTQLNCQTGVTVRTVQGLLTFHNDGTIAETSTVSSPAFRSPGHGLWEKIAGQSYSGKFIFQRFNADGSYAGTQKITQSFELSRFGNTFEASGTVQLFDTNNNLIGGGCATATGRRFE